jgi:hypothetical protein
MRCAFCGTAAEAGQRLLGGAGMAICPSCVTVASDLVAGRSPANPPIRQGWDRGRVDKSALASLSDEDLGRELDAVREILAPLEEFAAAAGSELRARRAGAAGIPKPSHALPAQRRHSHRTRLVFPDGTGVTGVSFDANDPYGRRVPPDFGLYLDPVWSPSWPHLLVPWPDGGLPTDPEGIVATLRSLHGRAAAGQRLEVGCLGGHGRTGVALACMAVVAGVPAGDAVAYVRQRYCAGAVETEEQAAFVRGLR